MCEINHKSDYCVILQAFGEKAEYAQAELEKYIYLLTGETSDREYREKQNYHIVFYLVLAEKETGLGEEGYEIHTGNKGRQVTISAAAQQGLLYGVYGLLSDYYGIGFYFSGDAIPQEKKPLPLLSIEERNIPKQYIRGILPWTNFPQSATSYSLQDWIYIIDQMTRMRMNFINIHNYNGEFGHNEIFHNILLDGKMSRNWNATASKPHAWGIKGWNVNEYLFGGKEVFDDYDFGADATLHNDCLGNFEVFQKGSSQFAFIIRYAHKRGVKIGLGLDLNLVMGDCGYLADDFRVVDARTHQIITDYPELDYLLLYRSENYPDFRVWNRAFYRTYHTFKEYAPNTRIAVSGWGLDPDTIIGLPADVIAAPISGHSVNDRIPDGSIYGEREFWGCPWSERDYNDSIHFAPYRTLLSNTIADYQKQSRNMKGLMTLTWRISDAVDAKISYIAEAPWDRKNQLHTSYAVYYRYASKCYGFAAAKAITEIINENEAYATDASECVPTPLPTGRDRSEDMKKADKQLAVIEQAIIDTVDQGYAERLKKLYCRIRAVKAFCWLDQNIQTAGAEEIKKEFGVFVGCFIGRIDDISTLGNLYSVENRYVQEWYLKRMAQLEADVSADTEILSETGSWRNLRVMVISPLTVITDQSNWDIKVVVAGFARRKQQKVTLYWRKAGTKSWITWNLEHRVNGVFGGRIPVSELPTGMVEYYVEAVDGEMTGIYPAVASQQCAVLSNLSVMKKQSMESPVLYADGEGRLRWNSCSKEVLWYRIYRGTEPEFLVGPQSLVTYVYRDTYSYLDVSGGFDGIPLEGFYYYKVSCVNEKLEESPASNPVCLRADGIGMRKVIGEQGKGDFLITLGKIDMGENTEHLYLYYGATEEIKAELWIYGSLVPEGKKLGESCLFATGRAEVREMGDIALMEACSGVQELQLKIRASDKTSWKIYGCCPAQMALRDSESMTDKVLSNAMKILKRADKTTEAASSKAVPCHKEQECGQFEDFWMISDLVGSNEDIEIGGLVYGYQYVCQVSEEGRILYKAEGEREWPFQISEEFLQPGHEYTVQVTARNKEDVCRSISHVFGVSKDNIVLLNTPELFDVKKEKGNCFYANEKNSTACGCYEIMEEGFCLSAGKGNTTGRFMFRLPWDYNPKYPYLLIKAEALAGDWTMQVNGVPVVGPKKNNVAMRKDLRIFGFCPGDELELTLIVLGNSDTEEAKTLFKSIQLLPVSRD